MSNGGNRGRIRGGIFILFRTGDGKTCAMARLDFRDDVQFRRGLRLNCACHDLSEDLSRAPTLPWML